MLYSIVGILVIILDQAVKFWVSDTLFGTDVVRFIPGVISLVNVHNDGAAFSFLSGQDARIYFIAATGVFVLLVVIALATNFIRGGLARWSLVLVAAGGLGNMIDRVIYGYVQDMFKVELFNFAIFNVADIFITVFAILFALAMIFGRPDSPEDEEEYEDEEEEAPKLSRKEKKALKAAEKAAAKEQAAEEAAAKKASAMTARKARQNKYEQEYEEYKAQQRADMDKKRGRKKKNAAPEAVEPAAPVQPAAAHVEAAPAPVRQPEPAPAQPAAAAPKAPEAPKAQRPAVRQSAPKDDPFAAWERANTRAEASQADSYAARAMNVQPAPKAEAKPQPAPAAQPKPVQPAAKPAPAAKPQPQSAPKDEFDLDDILAEFR